MNGMSISSPVKGDSVMKDGVEKIIRLNQVSQEKKESILKNHWPGPLKQKYWRKKLVM